MRPSGNQSDSVGKVQHGVRAERLSMHVHGGGSQM